MLRPVHLDREQPGGSALTGHGPRQTQEETLMRLEIMNLYVEPPSL